MNLSCMSSKSVSVRQWCEMRPSLPQKPVSTGRDELYPADCGRDPKKGTGKLCFPDGQLCKNSEWRKKANQH